MGSLHCYHRLVLHHPGHRHQWLPIPLKLLALSRAWPPDTPFCAITCELAPWPSDSLQPLPCSNSTAASEPHISPSYLRWQPTSWSSQLPAFRALLAPTAQLSRYPHHAICSAQRCVLVSHARLLIRPVFRPPGRPVLAHAPLYASVPPAP